MRAVISRVSEASVSVDGQTVGEIDGPGLLVLLGIGQEDGAAEVGAMVRKIAELRILREERGAQEAGAPVLLISQFTLMGSTAKGRRPSWSAAAPADRAEPLVRDVAHGLRERGIRVSTGQFGALMAVQSVNDGPFTVLVEV